MADDLEIIETTAPEGSEAEAPSSFVETPTPDPVMDEEKKRKAEERARKANVTRLVSKLKKAKSEDDLDSMYAKLRGKQIDRETPKPAAAPVPATPSVPPEILAMQQQQALEQAQAAIIENVRPRVREALEMVNEIGLAGTPFELDDKRLKLATYGYTPYVIENAGKLNANTLAIITTVGLVAVPALKLGWMAFQEYREEERRKLSAVTAG